MPKTFTALGIDVGGTKIAAGIVRFPKGEVIIERTIATQSELHGFVTTDRLHDLAKDLMESGLPKSAGIDAIGLGICELVSPEGRLLSHNCIEWTETELDAALGSLGPLFIEADVRAAARAEALFGAGARFKTFLYLTVGTGISSALVIETVPYLGATGSTGTMASSPLNFLCASCHELPHSTLEEIASGPALASRYNALNPGCKLSTREVLAAAGRGDADAVEVVSTAAESLGSIVGLLVNTLDPEAVIVGGGLGLAGGLYREVFISSTRSHVWSEARRRLPILRASTGPAAGLIGAAATAWKKFQATLRARRKVRSTTTKRNRYPRVDDAQIR